VSAPPKFSFGRVGVHHDPGELGRTTRALRAIGRTVVLVATMGALHDGHLQLVRQARRVPGSVVVVSVFVNPLQFGAGEDLDAYPRALARDTELLDAAGAALVFAPSVAQMYPHGAGRTTVQPGPLGAELEGAARPGHFTGVLTVVAKLLTIVAPATAFFGEKDYQQLVLIRQLVADLDLGVRIVGVPTVRDADGLALSSRNSYLDASQRRSAVVISAALTAGAHAGQGGATAVLAAARQTLDTEPSVVVDYLALRAPDLGPAAEDGPARLLVAATVGSTRLIDNVGVLLGAVAPTGTQES